MGLVIAFRMKAKNKYWNDERIEVILSNLLRWGVILSSIVALTGGIVYLLNSGANAPHYHTFRGLFQPFHNLSEVIKGTLKGNGQAIIQLGVVMLIATPVARIIFSIIGFTKEKDWLYILISSIVLCIIATSVLLGIKA
jgi:uncharacterized membrane protein